jgi:hypothetical protein
MAPARKRRRIGVRSPKLSAKTQEPRTEVLVRLVPGKKQKPA